MYHKERKVTHPPYQPSKITFIPHFTKKCKYGFQVPQNYNHALDLDNKFGSTHWHDATCTEMEQLDEYNTFIDKGKKDNINDIVKTLDTALASKAFPKRGRSNNKHKQRKQYTKTKDLAKYISKKKCLY